MPEYVIEESIAAGWDNAAGLALVSSLSVSSIPFLEVRSYAAYERGLARPKANGLTGYGGRAAKEWVSDLLWLPQWDYLRTTYEGKVTIRTWLSGTTYANYNAILTLPELREFTPVNTRRYGWAVQEFVWKLSIVEAL